MVADPEPTPSSSNKSVLRRYTSCSVTSAARIAVDFAAAPPPKSFLISPEGILLANGLKGDQIEKAVNDALSGRTDAARKTK